MEKIVGKKHWLAVGAARWRRYGESVGGLRPQNPQKKEEKNSSTRESVIFIWRAQVTI